MLNANSTFRWAILGTGAVARKFVLGLRGTAAPMSAVSVASRNPANARRFAESLGVSYAAGTYEKAVRDDVDAVYIATPPTEHEDHAMLAISAGKALLVEKPFAANTAAARRIAAAATSAGVFAMEAMWTRFLPLIPELKVRIDAGELGDVRAFSGTFLGANRPNPATSLFDLSRGGGALLHRGIYPISLARHLLGPITGVSAKGRIGTTGVDEEVALVMTHVSGAISTVQASLCTHGASAMAIRGTTGSLDVAAPIWRPTHARITPVIPSSGASQSARRFEALRESPVGQRISDILGYSRGLRSGGLSIRSRFLGNGYTHEALATREAVLARQTVSEVMPLSETIEILGLIEVAAEQIRGKQRP